MVRGLKPEQWHVADSSSALAGSLSSAIAMRLRAAIDRNGSASLVVSGGSTPKPVFEQLCQESLDWSKVWVTLADERWVPPDHVDSNERLVRECLLIKNAKDARFVSLYRQNTQPENSLDDIEQALGAMPEPFTVVILGMGNDGHTASLFPDTEGLDEALDINNRAKLAVLVPSTVPQQRISLTRRALINSEYRLLHITGQGKRDVLENALAQGNEPRLPITYFFDDASNPMDIYWTP